MWTSPAATEMRFGLIWGQLKSGELLGNLEQIISIQANQGWLEGSETNSILLEQ
jgi:hypothetical protein